MRINELSVGKYFQTHGKNGSIISSFSLRNHISFVSTNPCLNWYIFFAAYERVIYIWIPSHKAHTRAGSYFIPCTGWDSVRKHYPSSKVGVVLGLCLCGMLMGGNAFLSIPGSQFIPWSTRSDFSYLSFSHMQYIGPLILLKDIPMWYPWLKEFLQLESKWHGKWANCKGKRGKGSTLVLRQMLNRQKIWRFSTHSNLKIFHLGRHNWDGFFSSF